MAIPAMFVGQLFERVLFPALAQKQEDVLTMQRAFRASLEVSTMVALPVSIVMYNLSDEIVEVLFGSRWLSISPVLSILALGVFCRTTYKCGDTVIRSQGEMLGYTTRQVWYTGTVFVGSFIGATWFGIIGVAWAVVAGTAINYILMTQLAARLIAMPYTAVLYSHLPGIWISLCLGTVFTWGLQPLRTLGLNPFLTLLAVGFVSIAVVVAALTLGWGLIRKTSSFELGARYFARRVRPDTIVQAA
jgi:PST family polysaccharide transporter